jgi:aminoglycoside phosphotransferase (APT) family kinase protein
MIPGPPTVDELSAGLGFAVSALTPLSVTSGGAHSRIYVCHSAAGELIVRQCQCQQGFYTQYFPDLVDPQQWVDQAWALHAARSARVPAPTLLHSNRAARWMVLTRLPGVPIDSEYERWPQCPYDEASFGRILRRLHSIRPHGWGPINDEGVGLFPDWAAFLVAAARSAIQTCQRRGSLPEAVCTCLEREWVPRLAQVQLPVPQLLHLESLGFANLLYDPETREVTGLLDYEDCLGGDPLFEWTWMQYYLAYDGQTIPGFDFSRFLTGFGPLDVDRERLGLYAPFPYLDKLRWLDPQGTRARHYVIELARYCRQSGQPCAVASEERTRPI